MNRPLRVPTCTTSHGHKMAKKKKKSVSGRTVRRARPANVSRTQNFSETAAVSLPRESSSSCRFQFDASVVAAKSDTHTHAPKVKHIHARACGNIASRFRSEFSAQRGSRAARTLWLAGMVAVSRTWRQRQWEGGCVGVVRGGGGGGEEVRDISVNSGRARLRWPGVTVAVC